MEAMKKSKKMRKTRHRSNGDYKRNFLEVTKTLFQEKNKIIENLGFQHFKNISRKKHQSIQTEPTNICEESDLIMEKEEEIRDLTERLQQTTNKLYESKNACVTLKQDFNKAQKLLCSEVGENVSVSALSSQCGGGWRGRAEQIQQLQQKIIELHLKISSSDGPRRKSLGQRSSSSTRNFDKERKQQIENLTKELRETEGALESTRKKFEAAKARIAVLENDFNMSRKTIALLNEKTTHDNQLIKALHDQLGVVEAKFEDREVGMRKQNEKLEREIVLVRSELEASQIHIKNFKRQLDDRETEIEMAKKEANSDRKAIESRQINDSRETPMQSPRNCARDANEYIAIGIAAEAERERLLELVTVLNRRLDKERNDFEQLSESFRKQRNWGMKLETKLRKMELQRVVYSKVNTGSYQLKASKFNGPMNNVSDDSEELALKFELLQEECLALKTRLTTIKKDKCADLVIFKKLLDQTRSIFKDACRGKSPTIEYNSSDTI